MHTEYQLKNLKGELHMDGRKVLKRYFEENIGYEGKNWIQESELL